MKMVRPTLSAIAPGDWFHKESITLLAPDGEANVIISSEPLDPSMDTEQYAALQGELLTREFPSYRQHAFEPVTIGRLPGYVRDFSWTPPDGVPVTQIQLYVVRNGRGYTGTATTPSTRFAEREAVLRRTLLSAMFDGPENTPTPGGAGDGETGRPSGGSQR